MTSMRRRYVASTSLRRHVPAGNLPPPPLPPPQYSKPCPPPPPPNILNIPTPMLFNKLCALLGCIGRPALVRPFHKSEQLPICFPGRRIPSKLGPSLTEEVAPLEDHILPFENGCMNDLRFSVILYSISVISNRWVGDDEKLWTIKPPRLRLKRFPPPAGLEPRMTH